MLKNSAKVRVSFIFYSYVIIRFKKSAKIRKIGVSDKNVKTVGFYWPSGNI